MIGSLRGTVLERHGEGTTLVEVSGVGYLVTVTPRTLAELEPTLPAFLYIHHHIREDAQTLFGFSSRVERDTFNILIATHGIGPAMAMAILLNGMNRREITDLTMAMIASGERLDYSKLGMPTADKHSTGGVGDKVTLMLAPMVAACGAYMPSIAGRGLGHTGGTIDKLEAIPGYQCQQPLDKIQQLVKQQGCVIVSQSGELAYRRCGQP